MRYKMTYLVFFLVDGLVTNSSSEGDQSLITLLYIHMLVIDNSRYHEGTYFSVRVGEGGGGGAGLPSALRAQPGFGDLPVNALIGFLRRRS